MYPRSTSLSISKPPKRDQAVALTQNVPVARDFPAPFALGKPIARQPSEALIKIGVAAAILGVAKITVRRRVADGSLKHIRINGRLYFKKSELHAFVEAHRGNID